MFHNKTATLAISTVVGLEENMATTVVGEDDEDGNVVTTIGSLITSIAISRWDNEQVTFTEDNPLVLTFSVIGVSMFINAAIRSKNAVCTFIKHSKYVY